MIAVTVVIVTAVVITVCSRIGNRACPIQVVVEQMAKTCDSSILLAA